MQKLRKIVAGFKASTPQYGRDSRLDSLRGLALVIMMIDHLQGELKNYTYHVFGFVTAAEMFIFSAIQMIMTLYPPS